MVESYPHNGEKKHWSVCFFAVSASASLYRHWEQVSFIFSRLVRFFNRYLLKTVNLPVPECPEMAVTESVVSAASE